MANQTSLNQKVKQLQAENKKLKSENQQLKQASSSKKKSNGKMLRRAAAIFFVCLAVALAVVGNILFWAGNTVVKTDRFVETVSPIIENKEVQKAIATRATERIFTQVDAEQAVSDALPPRAAFLAPQIAGQLETQTQNVLENVLARPEFQDRFNDALERSHSRLITAVEKNGGDGAIDISEVYQGLSSNLKDTKLSFLADKPLPEKVGTIQLVKGDWISRVHTVAVNIDAWRVSALLLLALFSAAAIWLSTNRRRIVTILSLALSLSMFALLLGLRIAREVIAGQAEPVYQEAARQIAQTIFQPLVIQTATLMAAFAVVALVAWISGPSRAATAVKKRVSDLFAGKLHQALFGKKQPAFSVWLGKHKRQVEWLVVAGVAVTALLIRLTPGSLLACISALFLLILLVETLATSD